MNINALRTRRMPSNTDHPDALCIEAADLIERLLGLLQEARPHIEGSQNTTSIEEYSAAEALLKKIDREIAPNRDQQTTGGEAAK